jgi:predicted nucleotidyltransferase
MNELNKDFQEFIALLEARGVDYLVVGGYAVGLHGFPRFTGDLDFFVAISEANAAKLMEVFADFGFGDIGLRPDDFLAKDFVVEIGREPRKIQVLTGIDGVVFDECFAHRVEVEIAGMTVKFIGKTDLIRNKTAAARPKDLIDAEQLGKIP